MYAGLIKRLDVARRWHEIFAAVRRAFFIFEKRPPLTGSAYNHRQLAKRDSWCRFAFKLAHSTCLDEGQGRITEPYVGHVARFVWSLV